MDQSSVERAEIFSVHFQPFVSWSQRRVVGYEALARFGTPQEPGPGPAEVIAFARSLGVMNDLDTALLDAALARASERPKGALLFVNVLPSSLAEGRVDPGLVARRARAGGLGPHELVLELVEHDEEPVDARALKRAVRALERRGIDVAVDDAGETEGRFELSASLRPRYVKIGRKVLAAAALKDDRRLMTDIAWFVDHMGAVTIAEGVETARERSMATGAGIDILQGFGLGTPQPGFVHEAAGGGRMGGGVASSAGAREVVGVATRSGSPPSPAYLDATCLAHVAAGA